MFKLLFLFVRTLSGCSLLKKSIDPFLAVGVSIVCCSTAAALLSKISDFLSLSGPLPIPVIFILESCIVLPLVEFGLLYPPSWSKLIELFIEEKSLSFFQLLAFSKARKFE